MTESIYLMGSEDVRKAASEMKEAAETMRRAASEIHDTLTRFTSDFRELVVQLEASRRSDV